MEIPAFLAQEIQNGKAVLFLGAGASMGAKDSSGNTPPCGKKLGEMLADQFLGGKLRDSALSQIAELAINESNLITVQEFIKNIFEPFQPSEAHKLLPKFKWAGIATTNYDRLIERAYEADPHALQTPKPFVENGDRVEESMRDPRGMMLLKLHGCITRLSNQACPLILTTDQYISHRKGRDRIFSHLTNTWAYELPIVFVGHSLQDSDIRAILLELSGISDARPRYYVVLPKMEDIEVRLWEAKRITPIKASFEQFMQTLNGDVASAWRALPAISSSVSHPIKDKIAGGNIKLSANCLQFLESDVEYVKSATTTEKIDPHDFYRGYNKDWAAIEQNLDVRRVLSDQIFTDTILEEEVNKPKGLEFVFIKAHAGAGKTVLLRRIAWDAAHSYDLLCLYLKPSGSLNTAALQEIITVCKERVYLFIDDASDRVKELQLLIKNIEHFGKNLTVVAVERVNEWNVSCASIAQHVTAEYELKYLTNFEVDKLLVLLDQHKALGMLEGKTLEQQRYAFRETAARLLLVALHEATLGRPFEEIIFNEYANIVPREAQSIYLTICVLNRLGVPVRAGIIARLHGIRFEDFQNRLFKPLEHVVSTFYDPSVRDYMYTARHQVIAEIVFDNVLRQQEDRYNNYVRCLQALNIDYACDRKAFRLMVRGKTLLGLFSNPDLAKIIYEIAFEMSREDAYLYHQKGLYKMHSGNHREAGELLARAENLAPYDNSIKHTRSELLLKIASQARTQLEKERFLKEAAQIANSIKSQKSDSYSFHTLVKIDLERLKDVIKEPATESQRSEIEVIVRGIEKCLGEGLQRFPGDSYLLTAESEFADMINDSERVIDSLQKAFTANPRIGFVAARLAAHHCATNKPDEARKVFEAALNANRNDRPLHYHFARHLMKYSAASRDAIIYHLQRSFSPGDTNFDAQLMYARELYADGRHDESRQLFGKLKAAKIAPEFKNRMLYPLEGTYHGTVTRIEGNYAFLSKDGTNDRIHVHRDNLDETIWQKLTNGARCSYKIGFNFHGPGALEIKLNDHNR